MNLRVLWTGGWTTLDKVLGRRYLTGLRRLRGVRGDNVRGLDR